MSPWEAMLLNSSHPLPDGSCIRLRLPQAADRAALHALLAEHGVGADDLDVRRALRWTRGEWAAVCATRWDGGCERLVGFGAIGRGLTLIAPPDVAEVLREALCEHARTWNRRVA